MNWFEQIKRLSVKLPELGIFRTRSAEIFLVLFLLVAVLIYWFWPPRAPGELLNVAFDAGQTLYLDVDSAWKKQSGVSVYSLHAGSMWSSPWQYHKQIGAIHIWKRGTT